MSEVSEFIVKDKHGNSHKYITTLHPATEGQVIYWTFLANVLEPIVSIVESISKSSGLIKQILESDSLEEVMKNEFDIQELGKIFANLGLKSVATDLKHAVSSIDMSRFAPILFKHTSRDGKLLNEQIHFDSAYSGNYAESLSAMFKIIEANGFLSMPGISGLFETAKKLGTEIKT